MKKLLLISALSICTLNIAMDNSNQKIQLGSAQQIEQALLKKDPRFISFAQHKRIISLANRVTTPNSVEHIVFWVTVDDLSNTPHEVNNARDIQDATQAVVSTGRPLTLKTHLTNILTIPLPKL
jgi:hypothetical protein